MRNILVSMVQSVRTILGAAIIKPHENCACTDVVAMRRSQDVALMRDVIHSVIGQLIQKSTLEK
jgi:hypothetical protein